MRIALVDDCPNDLSIMHQFLAEALDTDSVITEFHNGEDFLQHWSADTFDLIVLDIYMEQLTGIEIARVIRETDPNVCLVFATTSNEFASESYEEWGKSTFTQHYLRRLRLSPGNFAL